METIDICSTDEFKNDPMCTRKKSRCSLTENIFWSFVLVSISFFTSIWFIFFDRIMDYVFGPTRSNYVIAGLAVISLVNILILAHFFEVDLKW